MNEQDLILLDTCLDIVEGWENDVYRPTQHSAERLSRSLREQLHTLRSNLASYRQVAEAIVYAPSQDLDAQMEHNVQLEKSVEMRVSA